MRLTQTKTTTYEAYDCAECGIPFALSSEFDRSRREDGKSFYCPNGHKLSYSGEVYELKEKLAAAKGNEKFYREQMRNAREERDHEARRSAAFKGQVTKIKKRVSAGVCPCCNRTFQNLARHMHGQHPEFAAEVNQ